MVALWTPFIDDSNDVELIKFENKYEELHEDKIELTRISRDPKEAKLYRMREN
ncbi:MAG: hypothetical protein R3Y64_06585 [Peptostreptococcaceae bacterium]